MRSCRGIGLFITGGRVTTQTRAEELADQCSSHLTLPHSSPSPRKHHLVGWLLVAAGYGDKGCQELEGVQQKEDPHAAHPGPQCRRPSCLQPLPAKFKGRSAKPQKSPGTLQWKPKQPSSRKPTPGPRVPLYHHCPHLRGFRLSSTALRSPQTARTVFTRAMKRQQCV